MYSSHTLPKQEYFNLMNKIDEYSTKIENLNNENKLLRTKSENVILMNNINDAIEYKNIYSKEDMYSKIIDQNNSLFSNFMILLEENNKLKNKISEFESVNIELDSQVISLQKEINELKEKKLFQRIFNI